MAEYQNYEEIPTEDEWDRSKQEDQDRPAQWKGRIARAEVSGMVDKWYEMDPEVETLLYDGTELVEGMIVLIETSNKKVDVRLELSDEELYYAHRWNRWMMISRIKIVDGIVWFLAEYEDGTQAKLSTSVNHAWLSKFGKPMVGRAEVTGQLQFADPDVALVPTPGKATLYVTEGVADVRDTWNHDHTNPLERRSLFEEIEDKWEQEKGTPFPKSPFDTQESQTPGTTNPR
jgi:hypothetical protein